MMGSPPLLPPRTRQVGDILPFDAQTRYPKTRFKNIVVLLACTVFTAAVSLARPVLKLTMFLIHLTKPFTGQTQGYDGTLMGGLNILPQYKEYFQLTNPLRSLNIAINYIGGALAVIMAPPRFFHWEHARADHLSAISASAGPGLPTPMAGGSAFSGPPPSPSWRPYFRRPRSTSPCSACRGC